MVEIIELDSAIEKTLPENIQIVRKFIEKEALKQENSDEANENEN